MLTFLLLACAHRAPADATAEPTEADRRAACAAGDFRPCMGLVALLEGETPTPERVREAVEIAARHEGEDLLAAQVSALVSNTHPEQASPEERARAWRTLCERHDFAAGCAVGGWEILAARPDDARALWDEGCALGLTHLCAPAAPADSRPVALPEAFAAELERVGATFRMPAGFHVVDSPDNPHFVTAFAIRSDDGRLEVRYGVRDDSDVLALTEGCKEQPGCISADFLKIEQSMIVTALANVGQIPPDQLQLGAFPPLPVRIEVNANWGLHGTVRAHAAFADDGAVTTLALLHQDPAANLYVFFIFHDLTATADLQPRAFHALRFTRPVGLGGTWLEG